MSTSGIDFTSGQIVDGNESLWRRIHRTWIKKCDNGICRPSSAAFKSKDVSVDIASKTTPTESIRDSDALASVLASVPKNLGHEVYEAPIKDDPKLPDNPAHAIIAGKINQRKAREIAKACKWVVIRNFS